MAKFSSLQIDVKNEDEVELTFETDDGATFTFTAATDDIDTIIEALDETFVEADEDEGKSDPGTRSS